MDLQRLLPFSLDTSGHRLGRPQRSRAMTMFPLFGPDRQGQYARPLSGLKLAGVEGYGKVELSNSTGHGTAIVPLHMGYIQDQAQNHALCRSALLGEGQQLKFLDACCVQQAQGGYLEGRHQWFFILPLELREKALQLKGKEDYGKLWPAISELNRKFQMPNHGHLEHLVCKERAYLNQYVGRFELQEGQTGALFLLRGKLVGLEIAPSAEYFEELWMPLTSFCYGASAMYEEKFSKDGGRAAKEPFKAGDLKELRRQFLAAREAELEDDLQAIQETPAERFELREEERFLKLRLSTVRGQNFAGQVVKNGGEMVYASVFAKASYLS